ncbi:MAG: hypothetical protein JNM17_39500 [Archangium sp.]|nr:hypothetical protein [Archangium sp.]
MKVPLLLVTLLTISACSNTGALPCTVGETRGCRCNTGTATMTCVAPEGAWTACGCTSREGVDVAVPPAPPPPSSCGGSTCAPMTEEDTEVGAKGCCTDDNRCGASSSFIFGTQCVPRGGDAGRENDACPSESANFIDLEGCCQPDGSCGLSIDTVPNFDLGCLERTEMERLINAGSADRDRLSRTFFLPVVPASFAAKQCSY